MRFDDVKRSVVRDAFEIVLLGGILDVYEEEGSGMHVWVYDDPWGGGVRVSYGGKEEKDADRFLAIHNNFGQGDCLLRVVFRRGNAYLYNFAPNTTWTLALNACLSEVRKAKFENRTERELEIIEIILGRTEKILESS